MSAQRRSATARRRRGWIAWIAGGIAATLVITLAVVASGFDSRETPREDPAIWTMRSTDNQYARVNTETAEIDTVRQVQGPSGVVQAGNFGMVLTQGASRAWPIDPASPRDIRDDATTGGQGGTVTDGSAAVPAADGDADAASTRTPDGTREVLAGGGWLLFSTEEGGAFLATAGAGDGSAPGALGPMQRLDPAEIEGGGAGSGSPQSSRVDAAAIDATGLIALYSHAEARVRWYDARAGQFRRAASDVPAGLPAEGMQLAIIGGQWVLFDPAGGRLWRQGSAGPVRITASGTPVLQGSSTADRGTDALVADEGGLWSVGAEARRVTEFAGKPARPQQVGREMIAAWVGSGAAAMWSAARGQQALEFDTQAGDVVDPAPVIQSNGTRALVSETSTGMMWTVPDGRLIPVEQWNLIDPPKQQSGRVKREATEQRPPVAADDEFGVRPGEPTPLPVLLNDSDPNRKDVLTIVPEGLGDGLPSAFGRVELLSDGQGLMLQPSGSATGTVKFRYRVTDGIAVSPPATVTLTVAGEAKNTAPAWCPVEGCQRAWPSPEIVPGGTLVLPVLDGWVDPEGDPMMLAGARLVNPEDPARVLVTADGRLAVRHTDPNAAGRDIAVRVRVADARGAVTERDLRVQVRGDAALRFDPLAATVQTGEASTVQPLSRVSGGSGSFALIEASVQSGAVRAVANQVAGTVSLSADAEGVSIVTVTVRDTVTKQEASGVIRVTAVQRRPALALPPLRAFVRPLSDTTVEVLDAIPGASTRALVVRSVSVVSGALRADVIEHARLRLSGSTADGRPGLIGSAEIVVAEGGRTARGRIAVFQVSEVSAAGAIAVDDAATVRAGSVVDIPVLDNDVAPPGERLVLHPDVTASGASGELAFVSGRRLRYLAPQKPGVYTLGYTAYGASSPEQNDVGRVRVTVIPAGANRDPKPVAVTVRVSPGEQVSAAIPVSNIDPDGDRVRLVGVEQPGDPQLSASIAPRTGIARITASASAEPHAETIRYTVRDDFGGEGSGQLRIIVTEPDPSGEAPVVYSDYVRMARGSADPVVIRPLDNDLDPSGGTLRIVKVVPNVPESEHSAQYRQLAARIDLSLIERGIVQISGSAEAGTVSYRYVAHSSRSRSTADGLIVVQVSDRVGRQAPSVQDTVLTVRDRTELTGTGVDVVTGRVQWATGDIAGLKLSLWGAAADRYRVSGSRIVGEYRAEGDLVPFRLRGVDATGEEVAGYGFLVVPPLDELRLTLKPGIAPLSVREGESVSADVRELLDLGPGDRVVLDRSRLSVQHARAACVATGDTAIRYSAAREAPWRDVCTVRVRLEEQRSYTQLSIPVDIVPDKPTVQLNPMSRTIAPGETQSIDLREMIEWQGGREGDVGALRWRLSGDGKPFEVQQAGDGSPQLQVTARADALTGGQTRLIVDVEGSGSSRSTLSLRVGEAAKRAPAGGTVALACEVGASCSVPLIGRHAAGQFDPFAGRSGGGLRVVGVDDPGCAYGRLRMDGDAVRVDWPDAKGPGGTCQAGFTVEDAQHRTGTGMIQFDASGVPRAPQSITAVGFTASSVKLEVVLGDASNAHPALEGVRIKEGLASVKASCAASGGSYLCEVGGLKTGERHNFSAVAVNRVGESAPTSAISAWGFKLPDAPSIDRVEQISAESPSSATLRFDVSTSDATTDSIDIFVDGKKRDTVRGNSGSVTISGVPVGEGVGYTAVPNSRFEHPGGDSSVGTGRSGTITVGGLPVLTALALSSAPGTAKVTAKLTADTRFGGELLYGASGKGGCDPAETSSQIELNGKAYSTMKVIACVRNKWGISDPRTDSIQVGGPPAALSGLNYTVGTAPAVVAGSTVSYTVVTGPSPTPLPDFTVEYRLGGNGGPITSSFPDLDPASVQRVYIRQVQGDIASDWAEVVPDGAPAPVVVDVSGCLASPVKPSDLKARVSAAARNSASLSYDEATGMLSIAWTGAFSSLLAPDPQPIPICP